MIFFHFFRGLFRVLVTRHKKFTGKSLNCFVICTKHLSRCRMRQGEVQSRKEKAGKSPLVTVIRLRNILHRYSDTHQLNMGTYLENYLEGMNHFTSPYHSEISTSKLVFRSFVSAVRGQTWICTSKRFGLAFTRWFFIYNNVSISTEISELLDKIEVDSKTCIKNYKRKREATEEHTDVQESIKQCLELADEKIQLAVQTYELVSVTSRIILFVFPSTTRKLVEKSWRRL